MTKYNPNDPYNRHGNRHMTPEKSDTGKKAAAIALGTVLVAGIAAAALYMVDVDQNQEARMPEINIGVDDGQMPKFDVDVADVTVTQKEVEVDVPTLGVETETKTIEVEVPVDVNAGTTTQTVTAPTINVERPQLDSPDDDTDSATE